MKFVATKTAEQLDLERVLPDIDTDHTIALEIIGPMPGTLTSRSHPASCRARAVISSDK
jgi:hypothetical protein